MALPVERVILGSYDLYGRKRVADQVEGGFVELHYPRNDIRNGNIEFVVEGNSEHCILPRKTFLKLTLELEGTSTAKKPPAVAGGEATIKTVQNGESNVAPINNIFHSIFSNVDVYLSNQATTRTDNNYPYISYFQTLCNNGEEPLNTTFAMTGWVKDTPGSMDSINDDNNGHKERKKHYTSIADRKREYSGKLYSPIFQQNKILPTQVSMAVRLTKKADTDFYLMHEGGDFKLKIVDAVLAVQKIIPTPIFKEDCMKMLSEGTPIPYELTIPSVNFMTIEPRSTQFVKDNLFLGKTPKRIIIGLVKTSAYHGDKDENPFNFQHFHISEITLYKDGIPFPRPITKCDFSNSRATEAYQNFLISLRAEDCRFVPHVTMEDFLRGYTLFSYDMSPDQLGSESSNFSKYSNIRLEIKFAYPTPSNITLIAYYEQDHLLEIHEDRRVSIDL